MNDWLPPAWALAQTPVTQVDPIKVLYEFDGPMIFVAKSDRAPLLFYKFAERQADSLYWAVPTNDAVIEALEQSKLSLYRAISQPWVWIFQLDAQFIAQQSWYLSLDKIPAAIGPLPGYGLDPAKGIIVEQREAVHNAFLSIHFQGGKQKAGETMPLFVLQDLINEVAQSAWQIFGPAALSASPGLTEKVLKKALTVPVHQPGFGSLLIELEQPRLNISRIRQRDKVNLEATEKEILAANDAFLEAVKKSLEAVATNKLRAKDKDTLELVGGLLPHEGSYFDKVTIQGGGDSLTKKEVVVDSTLGQKIWDKLNEDPGSYRTIAGKIVEISDRSESFILKRRNGREVTCKAAIDALRDDFAKLKRGDNVSVEGFFEGRKLRDLLWLRVITHLET